MLKLRVPERDRNGRKMLPEIRFLPARRRRAIEVEYAIIAFFLREYCAENCLIDFATAKLGMMGD